MGLPPLAVKAPIKMQRGSNNTATITNYDDFDKPAIHRRDRSVTGSESKPENKEKRFGAQPKKEVDLDYLDIPAFLRRQAD